MADDQIRVGDAERDAVTTALHEHFAQGRLTHDELEERLDATLAAKTVGDLLRVTRDLPAPRSPRTAAPYPAGPHTASPPWRRPPFPRLAMMSRRARFGILLLALLTIVAVAGPWWTFFIVIRLFFVIWLVTAIIGFRRARRRRHLPWPYR